MSQFDLNICGLQKLLRLQDVTTFRSDHPRKKSGIQLRSQIAWTFHFWSPFYVPSHPLAVRLQCLQNSLRDKKNTPEWTFKKKWNYMVSWIYSESYILEILSGVTTTDQNGQLNLRYKNISWYFLDLKNIIGDFQNDQTFFWLEEFLQIQKIKCPSWWDKHSGWLFLDSPS